MSTSTWDKAKERAENHKGNSIFVRLADDGDKVVVAFCGEPFIRELFWDQSKKSFEEFTKVHAADGHKPTPRYTVNAFQVVEKDGKIVPDETGMKVMEFSNATFKDVIKAKDKYGLDAWLFEIERSGKKGDTKTTYSILPEKKIEPAVAKLIAEAKLHDLSKINDSDDSSTDMSSHDKKKANGAAANGAPAAAPSLISEDQAKALIVRLKAMPKAKVDEFLAHFKVAKVKEVSSASFEEGVALLDKWEGKPAASEAPAEVDPFG